MQLKPQEQFAVVRQLSDPFDTGTYYVQAKIRNAHDDTLLATLNLSDKGNQRFRSDWQVPADPSGEGFYIDIETIVYTNSGYSTVSDVYGRENAVYLVQERQVPPFGGGGGDVSYDKVGAVVRAAIKADREEQEPAEKPQKVDLNGTEKRLLAAISGVRDALEGIDVPDNAPELKRLATATVEAKDAILKAIDEKPVTEVTDLAPVIQRIEKAETSIGRQIADAFTRIAKAFTGDIDGLREVAQKLVSAFNGTLFMVAGPRPKDEKIEMPEPKRPERQRRIPGATRGFVSLALVVLIGAVVLAGTAGVAIFNNAASAPTAGEQGPLGDTVNTLPQFTSTSSPASAITQRNYGKAFRLTGLENCDTIDTTSNGTFQCGTDATGGGGGGSGSVGTSTPDVDTYVTYFTSNSATPALIGAESTFTYNDATNLLTVTNASTTAFSSGYASSTTLVGGTVTVNTSLTLGGDTLTELCGTGITCTSNTLAATLGTTVAANELASADFGSFTCNGTTCTIDSQAVSSSMLANADFGDFTCSGGSCTVDANAIALATDTTGNYVATVSSSGSITVANSGTEDAAVTVNLNMGNANTWTALQTFANSSTTLASFNYASSTVWRGGGLDADCDSDAQTLGWDLTTGQFVCGDDDSGVGGGITTIKEDDSDVVLSATAIDFGSGFDVAAVVTEGNVTLDLLEYNGAALFTNITSTGNASTSLLSANQFWAGQTATTSVSSGGDLTVGGGDITLATSLIFSGGDTTSLNLIDAIDATTESTIEAAIDTLSNLTTTGALNAGSITSGFGTINIGSDSLTAGSILASSNDVGALGASGTAWADLFLADGGVVNWGAGGVTLTHTAASDSMTWALDAANGLASTLFTWALDGANELVLSASALYPSTDDGLTLGIANTNEWADIFLNTGGVINWANGDVTLTHASGQLTTSADNFGVATSTPWGRLGITSADTALTNALIVANSADTPLLRVQGNGTTTISGITAATSTIYGFSTAAGKGATIILEDTDGAGCTEVYALNGVLTAQTVTCPAEN